MKETPPVLTAGPAAWIRDRGRKRSGLLGTRPKPAAGGPGAAGSAAAPRTRKPSVRCVCARARAREGAAAEARVRGEAARLRPSGARRDRAPGPCEPSRRRPGTRGAPVLTPHTSTHPARARALGTRGPTWLGVGRPAPHMRHPSARGGSHIRLRPWRPAEEASLRDCEVTGALTPTREPGLTSPQFLASPRNPEVAHCGPRGRRSGEGLQASGLGPHSLACFVPEARVWGDTKRGPERPEEDGGEKGGRCCLPPAGCRRPRRAGRRREETGPADHPNTWTTQAAARRGLRGLVTGAAAGPELGKEAAALPEADLAGQRRPRLPVPSSSPAPSPAAPPALGLPNTDHMWGWRMSGEAARRTRGHE